MTENDLISRQATIEAFQMFRGYEANRTNAEWVDRIETVVKKLPSVNPQEPKTDWIPVSERLLEDTDPVNITWGNHDPESYYADIKDKPIDAMDDAINVMAWMPLLKPYEPQESEE